MCRFCMPLKVSEVTVAVEATVGIDWLEGFGEMATGPANVGVPPAEVFSMYCAKADLGAAAAVLMKKRNTEP